MKRLIILFVVLLIAVIIGLFMHADPGYVLIAYKNWSLETTLWVALLAIFLVYLLLHLIAAFWRGTKIISKHLQLWSAKKQHRKAHKTTNLGIGAWMEGRWNQAEKLLIKAAKHNDTPLINYLIAARAAQGQGQYDKRDNYLRQAHKSTAGVEVAVGLTQAQLQLAANQLEQALATLMHIKQLVPKHAYVLKLLQQAYTKLNDWKNLQQLLPVLRRYKVFTPEKLLPIERQTYLALLAQAAAKNVEAVDMLWLQIPKDLHRDPALLHAYTLELIKHETKQHIAEKILLNSIKKSWNSTLVINYGLITNPVNKTKQLATAEGWLQNHDHDPALFLCLGRLCKYQRLWGKAQSYLETCLSLDNKNSVIYFELGQLMELIGHKGAALDYYRQGLTL